MFSIWHVYCLTLSVILFWYVIKIHEIVMRPADSYTHKFTNLASILPEQLIYIWYRSQLKTNIFVYKRRELCVYVFFLYVIYFDIRKKIF